MSTTARRYWLKALGHLGVKHFRARTGLGIPFICHVGDFAGEVPFYDRRYSVKEVLLMSEWCRGLDTPVIFDVGANNGFIATQLAQLLSEQNPRIYAFEPVPSTFTQLVLSVEQLDLTEFVVPICCAVSDSPGVCAISYNPRESLFAQVRNDNLNPRVGSHSVLTSMITIDEAVKALNMKPTLIKIDVEGLEPQVVKGAAELLGSNEGPAICLEWNPITLAEIGASPSEMINSLRGYAPFYIDDFEGQRQPLGQKVEDLAKINWVCNIFALPKGFDERKWTETQINVSRRLSNAFSTGVLR